MTNCSNRMMVAPPPATPPLCSNLMYTVMYMAFSLTLPPDSRYLDVTEGGALAVCQSLYDHQWRHQLPLLDMPQNPCNVLLALLTREELRQSLHPQVGVFVLANRYNSAQLIIPSSFCKSSRAPLFSIIPHVAADTPRRITAVTYNRNKNYCEDVYEGCSNKYNIYVQLPQHEKQ